MRPVRHPKYFIAKHGLDAFVALPNVIWNTAEKKSQMPRGYRQVEKGDRWISFAYTTSDNRERRLSVIAGFSECIQKAGYGKVPLNGAYEGNAWMIKGRPFGPPVHHPVVIPPIRTFLSRSMFNQATITQIPRRDFERIQKYTMRHWLDPQKIPLLQRAPLSEQELLAIVACCHKEVGVEEILRIQTRFPDMLVKVKGKELHLELEVYSSTFLSHGHNMQVRDRQFKDDKNNKKPVAILCWIDDDKGGKLRSYVHKVYELQSLIRTRRRIRW